MCAFAEHILFGYICSFFKAVLLFNFTASPRNKGYKDFSPYRKKNGTTMLRFAVTLFAVITSSTCQKYGCLEGDTHKVKPSPEPNMHECTLYSKCKSGLIFAKYSLEVQLCTH